MTQACLNTAIDYCYAELDQAGGLIAMLGYLVDSFDLRAADIVTEDRWGSSIETHASVGFDPNFLEAYDSRYLGQNPWFTELAKLENQKFHHVEAKSTTLEKCAYYNEWARPQKLSHSLGAILENSHQRQSWIGFAGSSDKAFAALEPLLDELLPHVHRVLQTKRKIVDSARTGCVTAVLNCLTMPLVVLDDLGRKVWANDEANILFHHNRLLGFGHSGVPFLSGTSKDKQFSELIEQCLRLKAIDVDTIPALVIDMGGSEHLTFHFIPLLGEGPCESKARLALVAIPSEGGLIDVSSFVMAYGLTPSEARVTAWLASGGTLDGLSCETGSSTATLRWHLKNAEAKTGTKRSEQLVAKVLRAQLPFAR